jgi:hypothetical protein
MIAILYFFLAIPYSLHTVVYAKFYTDSIRHDAGNNGEESEGSLFFPQKEYHRFGNISNFSDTIGSLLSTESLLAA